MSEQVPLSPSPQFIRSMQAAIIYWRKRTQKTDDNTIHQLNNERQNLFQAVQFGLTLPQTAQNTAVVTLQTFDLAERQGYWQEWIPVLEQAIAVCTKEQLPLKFELLCKLGQLQRRTQQVPTAIETHKKAQSLAQQLHDKRALAIAYYNLSEDYLRNHDYAATAKNGHAALAELSDLEGEEYWRSFILNTLGELARFRGDLAESEKTLSEAVTIKRKLGEPLPLLRTLNNLAITLQTYGKLDAALQCYEEASELLTATPYEIDKIMIQINLGALYAYQTQWSNAEAILRSINFTYLRQSNKMYYEAAASQSLGNVILKQGRGDEATAYLQHAIALWQTIGKEVEQANSMGTLGDALVAHGQTSEAQLLYENAILMLSTFPDDARAQNLRSEFQSSLKTLLNR